jgi:hypothetical protein
MSSQVQIRTTKNKVTLFPKNSYKNGGGTPKPTPEQLAELARKQMLEITAAESYVRRLGNFYPKEDVESVRKSRASNVTNTPIKYIDFSIAPTQAMYTYGSDLLGQPRNAQIEIYKDSKDNITTYLHELVHASTMSNRGLNKGEQDYIKSRVKKPAGGSERDWYITDGTEVLARKAVVAKWAADNGIIDINNDVDENTFNLIGETLRGKKDKQSKEVLRHYNELLEATGNKPKNVIDIWNTVAQVDTNNEDLPPIAKNGGKLKKQREQPYNVDNGRYRSYMNNTTLFPTGSYQQGGYSWSQGANNVSTIVPAKKSEYATTQSKETQKDINKQQEQINKLAKNILGNKGINDFTDEDVSILSQATLPNVENVLRDYRINRANKAQEKPGSYTTTEGFRESTAAIGDKVSLQRLPVVGEYIPDVLDVTKGLGDMAAGLGAIPNNLNKGQYGQVAFNLGAPLLTGVLGGLGARTTGQFANNLVNPLAGVKLKKATPYSRLLGNLDTTSIPYDKGDVFLNKWINHPEFNNRYNPDGKRFSTNQDLSSTLGKYEDKDFLDLIKDDLKSGTIPLGEIPTYLKASGLSGGKPNQIYLKKSALKNPYDLESVRTHELSHLLDENGRTLYNTEMYDLRLPLIKTPIKNDNNKKGIFGIFKSKSNAEKDAFDYLTDPSEVHARMMQARHRLNLDPSHEFTEDMFDKVMNESNWYGMGEYIQDKKGFVDLMNKMWVATPAAAVGAVGLSQQNRAQSVGELKQGGIPNNLVMKNKYRQGGKPNTLNISGIPNAQTGGATNPFGYYGGAGDMLTSIFGNVSGSGLFKPQTGTYNQMSSSDYLNQNKYSTPYSKKNWLGNTTVYVKDASGNEVKYKDVYKDYQAYNKQAAEDFSTNQKQFNEMLPVGMQLAGLMDLQMKEQDEVANKKMRVQDFPTTAATYAPVGFAEEGGGVGSQQEMFPALKALKYGLPKEMPKKARELVGKAAEEEVQVLEQMLGYRDDSPFRNKSSINIYSDTIDMGQKGDGTGTPLLAVADNGDSKILKPYSGTHFFPGASMVTEVPVPVAQNGGQPTIPAAYTTPFNKKVATSSDEGILSFLDAPQKELMKYLFNEYKRPSELMTGEEVGSKIMGTDNYGFLADLVLDPLNVIPYSKAKMLVGMKGEKVAKNLSKSQKAVRAAWTAALLNDIEGGFNLLKNRNNVSGGSWPNGGQPTPNNNNEITKLLGMNKYKLMPSLQMMMQQGGTPQGLARDTSYDDQVLMPARAVPPNMEWEESQQVPQGQLTLNNILSNLSGTKQDYVNVVSDNKDPYEYRYDPNTDTWETRLMANPKTGKKLPKKGEWIRVEGDAKRMLEADRGIRERYDKQLFPAGSKAAQLFSNGPTAPEISVQLIPNRVNPTLRSVNDDSNGFRDKRTNTNYNTRRYSQRPTTYSNAGYEDYMAGDINYNGEGTLMVPSSVRYEGGDYRNERLIDELYNKLINNYGSTPRGVTVFNPLDYKRKYMNGGRVMQNYMPVGNGKTKVHGFIDLASMIPIQTEKKELIVLPTGDLVKVNASKRHSQMSDDEVTDIVPENSYILSQFGSVDIYKSEADQIQMEVENKPYNMYGSNPTPKVKTLGDIMRKKVMKPADMARLVEQKYKIMDHDDPFTIHTNAINKHRRGDYLQAIIQLSEYDKARKGIDNSIETQLSQNNQQPPQMVASNGGKVLRSGYSVPKAFVGLIANAAASLISTGVSAYQNSKARQRADKLMNQQLGETPGYESGVRRNLGLGLGIGAATTLLQDPTINPAIESDQFTSQLPSYVNASNNAVFEGNRNSLYANRPDTSSMTPQMAMLLGERYNAQTTQAQGQLAGQLAGQRANTFAQYLQARQSIFNKNSASRTAATNATRTNQNNMMTTLGGMGMGYFDNLNNLSGNVLNARAAARGQNTATQIQLGNQMAQTINNGLASGLQAYNQYMGAQQQQQIFDQWNYQRQFPNATPQAPTAAGIPSAIYSQNNPSDCILGRNIRTGLPC